MEYTEILNSSDDILKFLEIEEENNIVAIGKATLPMVIIYDDKMKIFLNEDDKIYFNKKNNFIYQIDISENELFVTIEVGKRKINICKNNNIAIRENLELFINRIK